MPSLNAIDAGHIEQTALTRGWDLMLKRLVMTGGQQLGKLRAKGTDAQEAAYLRGYLDCLDFIGGLPVQMISEARPADQSDGPSRFVAVEDVVIAHVNYTSIK